MRVLYFDCASGASGDMILGALIGVGVSPSQLRDQLALLGLENYELDFSNVDRSNLSATLATVRIGHEHHHRHLADILNIIQSSKLKDAIKSRASHVFTLLAEAEAEVHNIAVEKIHFHEVGGLDAIIDIVGACIGFELLGVDRFVCSSLHVGSGTVNMDHGRFPVPPPAVAALLRGAPIYGGEIKGELVTPTGAAIIKSVCESFGPLPVMEITSVGYGAGSREYEKFPNVLRIFIGEEASASVGKSEQLVMLETNIDDMPAQSLGFIMERAFDLGALDCYFTPVQMKKNRPGTLVSILCRPIEQQSLVEMLLTETTTLGVRTHSVERTALDRKIVSVKTPYGMIDIKVAMENGQRLKARPEFEQCRIAARIAKVSLRQVEEAAMMSYEESVLTRGDELTN